MQGSDSVFTGLKPIKVRRKGTVLQAPGICDDAAGVANLIVLAHALRKFGARTSGDIVFLGSIGEESGHDVWGMEHFWRTARYPNPLFIAVDGGDPNRIVTKALGTWSPTITVKGPGGHSYSCFGHPNPIHMLSRLVVKLTTMKADRSKDAIYNANMISGGAAPNVIPQVAAVTLNLRSSDRKTLDAMKMRVARFLAEATREELKWATDRRRLEVSTTAHGRPGGSTPESHLLVKTASAALRKEGLKPVFAAASTDSNMPMSLGLPAITLSVGGKADNLHSLNEWHGMTGRTRTLAALGRIVLSLAL